MVRYIYFNDKVLPAGEALVSAESRGLRYGDGLFETMRVVNGRIVLAGLHMERLFNGLNLLQFELPAFCTPDNMTTAVLSLCKKNGVEHGARVRLNAFRANGGLNDPEHHHPQVVIEAWPLEVPASLNENGLVVDVYPAVRKHGDLLSGLKTNNYLPSVMAALYAKKNRLNECLLLNMADRICDGTLANVFWIKAGKLFTPSLSEGGIGGVMRKYLLAVVPDAQEALLTVEELLTAEEVFLTNAIQGIRWVGNFRDRYYVNNIASGIYRDHVLPLWK